MKYPQVKEQSTPATSFSTAYDSETRVLQIDLENSSTTLGLEAAIAAADVVVTDRTITASAVSRERIAELSDMVIHADITTSGATGPYADRRGSGGMLKGSVSASSDKRPTIAESHVAEGFRPNGILAWMHLVRASGDLHPTKNERLES